MMFKIAMKMGLFDMMFKINTEMGPFDMIAMTFGCVVSGTQFSGRTAVAHAEKYFRNLIKST